MAANKTDRDGAWKNLIESSLPRALAYFLPEIYEQASLSKKPRFLSKEFNNAIGEQPARYVDELIDIPMKSGRSRWLLLHVEFQGHGGGDFSQRMMEYCYLIAARYRRIPIGLAILTEPRPAGEKLGVYEVRWADDLSLRYQFRCYKLYDQNEDTLLASKNLFSYAMYAAKVAFKCRGKGKEHLKYVYLERLAELMERDGYKAHEVSGVARFMASIIHLQSKPLVKKLRGEMRSSNMDEALTAFEEVFADKAVAKGERRGERKGQRDIIQRFCASGLLTLEQIAQTAGLSVAEVKKIASKESSPRRKVAQAEES